MNDDYIVPVYVIIDDVLRLMNYQDDVRASVSAAEVLTVAVVAARFFQNHHERALCILQKLGDIPRLSVSRFNRRLHALQEQLWHLTQVLSEVFAAGSVYIIDTLPLPVCKRVRARRCKKVQGEAFWGYCAAKDEFFFGWQLHLLCDAQGVPVAFDVLPARWDELTIVQDLLAVLPEGSSVVADKGYISDQDQQLSYIHSSVRLIPKQRRNMRGNSREDAHLIRQHRSMIETVNSQLEKMGVQRLHARTAPGFMLKLLSSLTALSFAHVL
ncbi:MAG: IS982 family transposase [Anaerolineae bacterium]|nr:IS982 family transposase [Anaerolineae bacterium]